MNKTTRNLLIGGSIVGALGLTAAGIALYQRAPRQNSYAAPPRTKSSDSNISASPQESLTEKDPFETPSSNRYLPRQINQAIQRKRSTIEATLNEELLPLLDKSYAIYSNEYSRENELPFMLADPNDLAKSYCFEDEGATVRSFPTKYLIPTRLEGKNKSGNTVAARSLEITVGDKPLILDSFTPCDDRNDTYFIIPRNQEFTADNSPFYFIKQFKGEESILVSNGIARVYSTD